MSGLITRTLINDDLTTISLIVADAFGKRHDNVTQAIERLQIPAEYRALNFQETEISRPSPLNGAPIRSKAYRLTRDGFSLLVMGFAPLTRGARAGRLVGHREKGGAGFDGLQTSLALQAAPFSRGFAISALWGGLWSGAMGGRKACRFQGAGPSTCCCPATRLTAVCRVHSSLGGPL